MAKFAKKTGLIADSIIRRESASGLILVLCTAIALIFANSRYGRFYDDFWNHAFTITFAGMSFSQDFHFLVNDVLMTFFFLLAGMEIRRELYDGALSHLKLALLPMVGAIGGVCFPAFIYFFINYGSPSCHGWAIPTATDIAFAVGILSFLGKHIPHNLKVILLTLAIIDDIIAIAIITLFYSGTLDINGLAIAFGAVLLIFALQWANITSAWFFAIPAAILWSGLLVTGIHPSLTGVILGLLTPVVSPYSPPTMSIKRFFKARPINRTDTPKSNLPQITGDFCQNDNGKAEPLAPITRVQKALTPWVQFFIIPLFALANAGINFSVVNLTAKSSIPIILGIGAGLMIGKPLGILTACFFAVKSGLCRLPSQVNWSGLFLIGMLGGIGFTMAIFTALLSFNNADQLETAKLAILGSSSLSAIFGLGYGIWYCFSSERQCLSNDGKKSR